MPSRRWPIRRRTWSRSPASWVSKSTRRLRRSATGLRDPHCVIVVARAFGGGGVAPLQPRDVIRSVNNKQVSTLASLRELRQAVKSGMPVTLQVQREGRLTYVAFTLGGDRLRRRF
jgi:S1-C subfamily serine protease